MVRKFSFLVFIPFSVFCLLLKGCIVNLDNREAYSDFKYDGYKIDSNSNRKHLKCNGFYYSVKQTITDTSYQYYIFYQDGMVYVSNNIIGNDINSFKNKLVNTIQTKQRINYYNYGSGLTWGLYKTVGNKLIVRICFAPGEMGSYAWEEHFLIKDSVTIENIGSKDLPENKYGARNKIGMITPKKFAFYSFDSIPNSDCWLKTKRWFWADKEAYKSYKKERSKKQNK